MSYKILLIEDMKGVRDCLKVILGSAGHVIDMATNGREGLEKARGSKYDLIITDILMPELDGTEVIMQLKASNDTTPILAISAGGGGASNAQALSIANERANGTLKKPFSKDEILEKITELLG